MVDVGHGPAADFCPFTNFNIFVVERAKSCKSESRKGETNGTNKCFT